MHGRTPGVTADRCVSESCREQPEQSGIVESRLASHEEGARQPPGHLHLSNKAVRSEQQVRSSFGPSVERIGNFYNPLIQSNIFIVQSGPILIRYHCPNIWSNPAYYPKTPLIKHLTAVIYAIWISITDPVEIFSKSNPGPVKNPVGSIWKPDHVQHWCRPAVRPGNRRNAVVLGLGQLRAFHWARACDAREIQTLMGWVSFLSWRKWARKRGNCENADFNQTLVVAATTCRPETCNSTTTARPCNSRNRSTKRGGCRSCAADGLIRRYLGGLLATNAQDPSICGP